MTRMFYLNYSWHYSGLNIADVPLSNKQTNGMLALLFGIPSLII